jgi:creatinine amidohydrolase
MSLIKTTPHMFANLNWKDLSVLKESGRLLLLLPIGSTESHGPHGPLCTDILISTEVCLRAASVLQERGFEALVLPPLAYAVTECAKDFPGSISISPEVETGLIVDICISLIEKGMSRIVFFNSHFEPAHLKCIYDALDRIEARSDIRPMFTDITRKRYASRLSEAFRKGETHADRYETSLVMAVDPGLVNEERRRSLPYLPINLVEKIFRENLKDFNEFGMSDAYCGDPASASAEEGELLLHQLVLFLLEDAEQVFGAGMKISPP